MTGPPYDPASMPGAIAANWDMTAPMDPRLQQIYAYWKSRCGGRQMPSRADINPLDMPALLPFIFLVDVLSDPSDFRFRLIGTHFRDAVGAELTGRLIGEVFPPAFSAEVRYYWSESVNRKEPAVGSGKLWIIGRDHVTWNGIVLPLSPDDSTVNMLLGGVIFSIGQVLMR